MSWDFFNTRIVRTRKPHQCEQCRQQIAAGESCHYGVGVFDGDFFAYYEHSDCRAAWQEVQKESLHDEGYAPFLADEECLSERRDLLFARHPTVAARLWPGVAA